MNFKQTLHHLNLRSTHLLPKFNKTTKVILTICFVFCLSLSLKSILAAPDSRTIDTTDALQKYSNKQTAIEKGNNQESWINESLISNTVSLNQALAGNLEVSNTNNSDGTSSLNWTPGGLIGLTNQSIASLYNPPASGVQYIADSVNSFLGKPAYAAEDSFGFNRLKGILDIWKTMRNTVYTLISLFFIITGIMIMLRVKLSPQATVTIQSAIPGIISSLILVTFSYAIAGLMIDLSYLFMGVVLSIFSTSIKDNSLQISSLMDMNFFGFVEYLRNNVVQFNLTTTITSITGLVSGIIIAFVTQTWWISLIGLAIGMLIVYLIILIQVVKFFFGLAKCYIMLLIRIILGPLEIGMGAIPGSKLNFSSWFTEVLANIAVFPISVIFLVLMSAIINACKEGSIWAPPILGGGNQTIALIIGIASLFILSKLPELIPQMVFNIKPSPIGKAFDESTKGYVGMAKFVGRGSLQHSADIVEKRYTRAGTGASRGLSFLNSMRKVAATTGLIKDK